MGQRDGKRICGDFGGTKPDGTPCGRQAGWGRNGTHEGPCRHHTDAAQSDVSARKKSFLDRLRSGDTILEAAAHCEIDQALFYRYRRDDLAFAEAWDEARAVGDARNVAEVERSLVTKLKAGDAPPALYVFYLVNRAGDRWKHVQTVEHTHRGKVQHEHYDLSKLKQRELDQLEQLARRATALTN